MHDARLKLAVLISGGGTTFRNFLKKRAAGQLDVDVSLVISSKPKAGGLKFAAEAEIPTRVVQPRDFVTAEGFRDAVFDPCREVGVDYVVMAGFLKHVLIPPDFENRVLNIHPGLIPSFCGKGFYGLRVHQAVLDYGAKVTGCTVHFVDQVYDHGPIILQKVVPVLGGDTAEVLAARVFEAECEAYPEAIRLLAADRVRVIGRRVEILPATIS